MDFEEHTSFDDRSCGVGLCVCSPRSRDRFLNRTSRSIRDDDLANKSIKLFKDTSRDHLTSVVVVSQPVGPGTVTTPPHPPTQLVTTTVDVAIVVTHFVVPFSVVVEVTYERRIRY